VQAGTTWRIGSLGATGPAGARYGLAGDLRKDAGEREEDPETKRAMLATAHRLDPEDGE
jgi:hypothetical protein